MDLLAMQTNVKKYDSWYYFACRCLQQSVQEYDHHLTPLIRTLDPLAVCWLGCPTLWLSTSDHVSIQRPFHRWTFTPESWTSGLLPWHPSPWRWHAPASALLWVTSETLYMIWPEWLIQAMLSFRKDGRGWHWALPLSGGGEGERPGGHDLQVWDTWRFWLVIVTFYLNIVSLPCLFVSLDSPFLRCEKQITEINLVWVQFFSCHP